MTNVNVPFSALSTASVLTGTEVFPLDQGGTTKSANISDVVNLVSSTLTSVGGSTFLVGLNPVAGSTALALRRDSTPGLDQSISPTWTGPHRFNSFTVFASSATFNSSAVFNGPATFNAVVTVSGTSIVAPSIFFSQSGASSVTGQVYQNLNHVSIANSGIADRLVVDLLTGNTTFNWLTVTSAGITFTSTLAGIVGVSSAVPAQAGQVGEYLSQQSSVIQLPNGAGQGLASINLTPGDWDVSGAIQFSGATTTIVSILAGSLSTTNGGIDLTMDRFFEVSGFSTTIFNTANVPTENIGPARYLVAANTTIFLNAFATYSVSSCMGQAKIWARRVR